MVNDCVHLRIKPSKMRINYRDTLSKVTFVTCGYHWLNNYISIKVLICMCVCIICFYLLGLLYNGDNKERLFELLEEMWIQQQKQLGDRTVYLARKDICTRISRESVCVVDVL